MNWNLTSAVISLGIDSQFGVFSLFRCPKVNSLVAFLKTLDVRNYKDLELSIVLFIYMLYQRDIDINLLDEIPYWKVWRNNMIKTVPYLLNDAGFNLSQAERTLKNNNLLFRQVFDLTSMDVSISEKLLNPVPEQRRMMYVKQCDSHIKKYIAMIVKYYPDMFSGIKKQEQMLLPWMKAVILSVYKDRSSYELSDIKILVAITSVKELNDLVKQQGLVIDFEQIFGLETYFIDLSSVIKNGSNYKQVCEKLSDSSLKIKRQDSRGTFLRHLDQMYYTLEILKMQPYQQMSLFISLLRILSPERTAKEKTSMMAGLPFQLHPEMGMFDAIYITNMIVVIWACFCDNYERIWKTVFHFVNISERRKLMAKMEHINFQLLGNVPTQYLDEVIDAPDYAFGYRYTKESDEGMIAVFPLAGFISKHTSWSYYLSQQDKLAEYLFTDRYNWLVSLFTKNVSAPIIPQIEKKIEVPQIQPEQKKELPNEQPKKIDLPKPIKPTEVNPPLLITNNPAPPLPPPIALPSEETLVEQPKISQPVKILLPPAQRPNRIEPKKQQEAI